MNLKGLRWRDIALFLASIMVVLVFFIFSILGIMASINVFIENSYTYAAYSFFMFIRKEIDQFIRYELFFLFIFLLVLLTFIYGFSRILERKKVDLPENKIIRIIWNKVGTMFENYKKEVADTPLYTKIAAILLIVMIDLLIIWQRFREIVGIVGFDSPSYIYSGELTHKYGPALFLKVSKPIPSLISCLLYNIFRTDFDVIGVFLLVIFSLLYILMVSGSIYYKTKDFELAIFTGIVAPLSWLFIRTSYDLYGQLLANGFLFVFLVIFSSIFPIDNGYLSRRNSSFKRFFSLLLIIGILYLTHFWTTVLAVVFTLSASFGFLSYKCIKNRTFSKEMRYTLKFLSLLAVFIILGILVKTRQIYLLQIIIAKGEFRFFTIPPSWRWYVGSEIPLIWILSIIGALALLKRDKNFGFITILWTLYVTSLVVISGYSQAYRFFLLYPLPFFVGAGLDYIYVTLSKAKNSRFQKFLFMHKKKFFSLMVVGTIIFVLIGETVVRGYIPEFTYRPDAKIVKQLTWIREQYGFDNHSILVVMDYHKLRASFYWPLMIIGSNIYFGSLEGLINGEEDFLLRTFDWQSREIIIPNETYKMNPVEKALSEKISDLGIYKVINNTLLEDFLKEKYEFYPDIKEAIEGCAILFQDDSIRFDELNTSSVEIRYLPSYSVILINGTRENITSQFVFHLPKQGFYEHLIVGYKASLNISIVKIDVLSQNVEIATLYLRSSNGFIIDFISFEKNNLTALIFTIYYSQLQIASIDLVVIDFVAFL